MLNRSHGFEQASILRKTGEALGKGGDPEEPSVRLFQLYRAPPGTPSCLCRITATVKVTKWSMDNAETLF
jgi:hypothetical protein